MLRTILKAVAAPVLALLLLNSISVRAQDQPASKDQSETSKAKPQSSSAEQSSTEPAESEKETGGKTHFRLGTVSIGASYTHFSNGFIVPFWPYGYPYVFGYSPFFIDWYYPYYYPSFYGPYPT